MNACQDLGGWMIRSILSLISNRSLRSRLTASSLVPLPSAATTSLSLALYSLCSVCSVGSFVYERLECISGNVQVSEQIMRNWHFFTSVRVVGKVLTTEDSRVCAGL